MGGEKKSEYFLVATELRITPAWAGKRSTAQILRHLYGDHPRVGGEKTKKIP